MVNTLTLRLIALLIPAFMMSACSVAPPAYDILIQNGNIVDGSGAPAYKADIAIVGDEIVKIGDTVKDNDDWAHPHQYASGFSYVIVGGTPVIDNSTRTNTFPGRVLRKGN